MSPSKGTTTSWVPPRYWRVAIPFGIIFMTMLTVLSLFLTATPQLAIRESCIDLGLPPECSADAAINAASYYNIMAMAIPGIFTLVTVGIFGSTQNQIGRPLLLFITTVGMFLFTAGWLMVYVIEDSRPSWKFITIAGATLQALTGGFLVVYLAIFGTITDLSSRHPEKRVYYYVVFDLLSGLCTLIGTQGAAFFLEFSPAYLTITSASALGFLLIFTILCLPETVSPQLKSEPVHWKGANIFAQIRFMFHNNPTTRAKLEQDSALVFNKIKAIYELQNDLPFSQPFALGGPDLDDLGVQASGGRFDSDQHYHPADSPDLHHRDHYDRFQDNDETSSKDPAPQRKGKDQQPEGIELYALGGTDSQHPLQPASSHLDPDQDADHSTAVQLQLHTRTHPLIPHPSILPPLELPEPPRYLPPKNGIGILLSSLGLNMLVFLGHKVCDLYYLKHTFHISPHDYSNLLSLSVLIRSLVAMGFFPLFKRYVKTPSQEIAALYIGCAIQGLLYLFYPFMPTFTSYCVLSITNYIVSVLPTSVVRSGASNHVSEKLQQYVLAALVASEVLIMLVGGVLSNVVWIATSRSFPGTIYILCALLSFAAALILFFFLQDPLPDYNLRIAMTTQFTKIVGLETKQDKLSEQMGYAPEPYAFDHNTIQDESAIAPAVQ